jgi:hypothetical protein
MWVKLGTKSLYIMPMKFRENNRRNTSITFFQCKLNFALIFYILHLIENKFCQGDIHRIYFITVNFIKISSAKCNEKRENISILIL